MFGSKNLLVAFFLGSFGISLITGSFASELPGEKVVILSVGLSLLWISALFGPIFFMKDRGIGNQSTPKKGDPGVSKTS